MGFPMAGGLAGVATAAAAMYWVGLSPAGVGGES